MKIQDFETLLIKQLEELRNTTLKDKKHIREESLKNIFKYLSLPNELLVLAQELLEIAPKTKIVWLHLCECTGCTESFLRSVNPSFDELIFDLFSLEYHETLMAADGFYSEELLDSVLEKDFILVVEGAVGAIDTYFLTLGAKACNGFELLQKIASKAQAIFAVGTCSSYGGIQAAQPNPSKSLAISEVLMQKVVNIPGCPPSDINIIGTLFFYALFKILPQCDEQNRPIWAYGKCLHDMCERKARFESGIFAQEFGDDLAKNGACLFKVGCKGPYTYNNCPKVKFNSKTSWPVAAGHGCIACSEKDFWDDFGSYEKPMINAFAYKNFSFEGFKFRVKTQKDDKDIILNFESMQILYKNTQNELCNFLNFDFESNLKLILQNIAKNKLGASLVQNYQKKFTKNYDFIQTYFDDNSVICSDLYTLFNSFYILTQGEVLKDIKEFLALAKAYKFKHASPMDIKLNLSENEVKIDVSKSFRMPLIYLCGGLDSQAIAFSLMNDLGKNLSKALKFLSQNLNQSYAFEFGNYEELKSIFNTENL